MKNEFKIGMLILFFSIIATKTQAQQIFDGNIKNNSLAIPLYLEVLIKV